MIVQPEDRGPARRVVTALALEDAGPVVEGVRKDGDLRAREVHQLPGHPHTLDILEAPPALRLRRNANRNELGGSGSIQTGSTNRTSAAITAVSTRRVRGPRDIRRAPFFSNSEISAGANPPSGPMASAAACPPRRGPGPSRRTRVLSERSEFTREGGGAPGANEAMGSPPGSATTNLSSPSPLRNSSMLFGPSTKGTIVRSHCFVASSAIRTSRGTVSYTHLTLP